MRLPVSLAVITFLIPQVATAQLVRHNSIPEAYWGTWAPADANCQDANKPSIALSEHAYESSTTSCVVKYLRKHLGRKALRAQLVFNVQVGEVRPRPKR
jgi:hypothetical protein